MKKFLMCFIGSFGMFMVIHAMAELIVLASPPSIDNYYKKSQDKIIDFQANCSGMLP